MALYQLDDKQPQLHPSAWVAPSADVMGDVRLDAQSSVWFGVVIRGDNEPIHIGEGSNIQDGSMLHSDLGKPLTIGKRVTIGHKVMLHGCTIGDNTLVGMGAIILNDAVIGKNCVVAAGSLVLEGKTYPEGSLIMGSPAKAVRAIDAKTYALLDHLANSYIQNTERFRLGLKRLD